LTPPPAPPARIDWADPSRSLAFAAWLDAVAPRHGIDPASLRPASSDASFRRYFRADRAGGGTVVVMDAPPPQEDVRPFVHVAGLIAGAGLNAPRILEADLANGFLLLDDLGDRLYLHALQQAVASDDSSRVQGLMRDAIGALLIWQLRVPADGLPPYDDALLRRELALFPEWCVVTHCGVAWSEAERDTWRSACDLLVASALAQPRVAVAMKPLAAA